MRLVALFLACLVAWPARADDAGDREIARRRYEMGTLLYKRGRYSEALVELEAAKAALDRPEFDYNIGLCLARLDRPVEAANALERFVRARPNDPEAPSIRKRILELRQQTPAPPPPKRAEPTPPPPPAPAPVTPAPAPVAAPSAQPAPQKSPFVEFVRTPRGGATVATASLSVVTLLAAAITGGVALSRRNFYDDSCAGFACNRAYYDDARALAITTDVMLGLSVAAAATTAILIFTRPKERPVALAPSGVEVRF